MGWIFRLTFWGIKGFPFNPQKVKLAEWTTATKVWAGLGQPSGRVPVRGFRGLLGMQPAFSGTGLAPFLGTGCSNRGLVLFLRANTGLSSESGSQTGHDLSLKGGVWRSSELVRLPARLVV